MYKSAINHIIDTKSFLLLLILMGALSLGGGCTDDDSSGDDPAVNSENFPEVLGAAMCARVDRCCTDEDREHVLGELGIGSDDECEPATTEIVGFLFEAQLKSIDAGRASLDHDKFSECINAYQHTACDTGEDPPCDDLFEGLVPTDGDCAGSYECADGICEGTEWDNHGNVVTEGTCKAIGREGDECEDFSQCRDGYNCVREDFTEPGTCQRVKMSGEACEEDSECDSYDCEDGVCAEDLDDEPEQYCLGK